MSFILGQTGEGLGGEDGLREDDLGEGMTREASDWGCGGGGGVGMPPLDCGEEEGWGEPAAAGFLAPPMLCCIRQ